MVPLYAARIEDLGPGDFVRVECAACGHDVLIPPNALLQGFAPAALVPSASWAGPVHALGNRALMSGNAANDVTYNVLVYRCGDARRRN